MADITIREVTPNVGRRIGFVRYLLTDEGYVAETVIGRYVDRDRNYYRALDYQDNLCAYPRRSWTMFQP